MLFFFFLSFRFPESGVLLHAELRDQGQELLTKSQGGHAELVPILGLLQTKAKYDTDNKHLYNVNSNVISNDDGNEEIKKDAITKYPGRIVIYGDSNCIDDSDQQKRKNRAYLTMPPITRFNK